MGQALKSSSAAALSALRSTRKSGDAGTSPADNQTSASPTRKKRRGDDASTDKGKEAPPTPKTPTSKAKSATSPAAKRAKTASPAKSPKSPPPSTTPPNGWREILDIIRQLRETRDAAVDTMGCERLADPEASIDTQNFQTLISLMLSSQTKDEVNAAAMARLREHNGCTASTLAKMESETLNSLIRTVGFHNNKTKYLLKASQRIVEEFDGRVPEDLDTLLTFDGVGPKMAIIYLNVTREEGTDAVGIGVDTHVHRISQQLGWVPESKDPEKTRRHLEAWMPQSHWSEINVLMVGLGQQVQASGGSVVATRAIALAAKRRGAADEALKPVRLALTLGVKPATIAQAFADAPASLSRRPGIVERLSEWGVKVV